MSAQVKKVYFKNGIDGEAVQKLGSALQTAWPDFPRKKFVTSGSRGLSKLELKARVHHLIKTMSRFLPEDYPEALDIVRRAGLQWPDEKSQNPFAVFAPWPLIDWVGTEGLNHPALSLAALRQLTPLFSAEFAVRPYLEEHTESTLAVFHTWVDDENHHVRRLISEGTRPRLPWGQQLPKFRDDPTAVLAILEKLKNDESEYVRRSVANNLNDLAKDHPELVVKVARRWLKKASPETHRLVSHALRTLIKQGHPGALKALGFETRPQLDVTFAINAKSLDLGQELILTAEIRSQAKRSQNLVVDYVVRYQKANGTLSPKVFKWKVLTLKPGESILLKKKQRLVSRSVRKLHPGHHEVAVTVAGIPFGEASFVLEPWS